MRAALSSVVLATVAFNAAPVWGKSSGLDKVITLLGDLRHKVSSEGEKEAKSYDAFACFCKSASEEKNTAVDEGETLKDKLQADLNELMSQRDAEDATVAELTERVGVTEAEMTKARKVRREERLEYEGNEVDLTGAVQALEAAIRQLKATQSAVGLVELQPVAKTLRRALLLAEGLGTEHHALPEVRRVLAALVQDPEVPTTVYEFHGSEIVDTLEDLLKDFRSRKEALSEEEVAARQAHDQLMQDKEKAIEDDEAGIEAAKKEKAQIVAKTATTSQDLTTTSAQLLDDQKYLAELTAKCSEKAVVWDQRSKVRADELQALTEALSVIKPLAESGDEVEGEGALLVQAKVSPPSFAQLLLKRARTPHHALSALAHEVVLSLGTSDEAKRDQALALLRSKGAEMKSALLSGLATKAAADPFVKVKQMIQELIERLLKEAASEASHKGWCDKEMGLAEQSRDQRAADIAELNGRMASEEARRDKLTELVSKLDAEIAALQEELDFATEYRGEEKEENAAIIKEAQDSREAVAEAMDILSKFYKTSAKASVSLLMKSREAMARQNPDADAPDAGFEGAYTGAQGASVGVMGMLEVVKSDFERTAAETEKAEEAAAQDFLEYETTAKASLATKGVAQQERSAALNASEAALAADKEGLLGAQGAFDKALEELAALHPACVGEPMSAEERKQRREEEMGALREALCILDSHGSEGADC